MDKSFSVNFERDRIFTAGLVESLGFDLELPIRGTMSVEIRDSAQSLLRNLVRYFQESGRRLSPGEKIDWASSLLIAKASRPNVFSFDEMSFDGEHINEGVDDCLRIWSQQSAVCSDAASEFCESPYGSMAALSPGVLSSSGPLIGFRYDIVGQMSGWWIFSDGYNGSLDNNFASVKPTHIVHLLSSQPRVAPMLGLKPGFAFEISAGERDGSPKDVRVWFDAEIASEVAESQPHGA